MALIRDSKLVALLREGRFEEFNQLAAQAPPDLRNADLRMLDLRHADLAHADLRGLNLSGALLEGASLHDTRVSGVLFPPALKAEEIRLSLAFGTRMRLL